jgi:molecular chaperone GrpE
MSTEQEISGSQAEAEQMSQQEQQVTESEEEGQNTLESLKQQLEDAQQQSQENWDKAVRVQADMENLKRRTQKDVENAHKYALEKFARELVNVVDSLELGIQAATSDTPEVAKLREGMELTLKQLQAVLKKFNIEALDPTGKPFNPEHHQAMSMQPSDEHDPNTVVNVFQKGYLLNDRLIRPAMVVVSKGSDKKPEGGSKIDEQA